MSDFSNEKLGNICQIIDSGVKKFIGTKKYIATGDVYFDKIQKSILCTYQNRPNRANMEVCVNDVLLAKMKDTVKTLFITEYEKNFIFSTGFAVLRTRQNIHPKFLFYYIQSTHFQQLKNSYSLGATQIAINKKNLIKLPVKIPPINEQKQIVTMFSNIDSFIELTDKIIENTKLLKIGLMQKLLIKGNDHTEFKKVYGLFEKEIKIPKTWTMKTLSECSRLIGGSTPSRKNLQYWKKGTIPWVSSGEVSHGVIKETNECITEKGFKKSSLELLPKNTILLAITGNGKTRGKSAILEINATINQNYMGIICDENIIHPKFLLYNLKYNYHNLRSLSNETNQGYLNKGILSKYLIPIPPIIEQKQIVTTLSNLDNFIQQEITYRKNLELIKNYMMQKILTGQIIIPLS